MIKILVVDDNSIKLQRISGILQGVNGITEDDISVESDIVHAKRALLANYFDVLLLDIQLPNRFDQEVDINGGINLLNDLRVSNRYNLPGHIIVLTSYDESYDEFLRTFANQLISIVKYDESSDDWSVKIAKRIEYILSSKKSYLLNIKDNYNYDLAIVTAVHNEEESIKRLSTNWVLSNINNDSTNYYTTTFTKEDKSIRVVRATADQMGMPASSILSMKIINNFRPKYLVMSGIAAGVKERDVNFGDILVADPSWDYGNGKIIDNDGSVTFEPDPLQIRINPDILSKITQAKNNIILLSKIKDNWPGEKPDSNLSVHIGPVASGSSVLSDDKIIQLIQNSNRKLIGIDMETYGMLLASIQCSKPKPIAFSIKSVSDYADIKKSDKYQRYAAYTSAAFLYDLATKYLDYNVF